MCSKQKKNKNNDRYTDETMDESIDMIIQEQEEKIQITVSTFYNNFSIIVVYVFNKTCIVIKYTINIAGIYFLWIILHYFASHLYIKFCVPHTIIGFFMSPFMTATPHCQGLRWIIYNGANMINNMWVVLGTWICSALLILNKHSNDTVNET
jgi:hypothetical protein